jgi:hypothetical protein
MSDFLTLLAFFAMVLAPCMAAMTTRLHDGADLGRRDESEPLYAGRDPRYIPS